MRKTLWALLLGCAVSGVTLSSNEAGCPASRSVHVERTLSAVKDWDGFFAAYLTHGECVMEETRMRAKPGKLLAILAFFRG